MGEGTLAYELQDALTRRIAPELLEQPNRERLTYEWTFLLAHLYNLGQSEKDETLKQHPEIVDYALILTAKMSGLDSLADYLYPSNKYDNEPGDIKRIIPIKRLPELVDLAEDTYYAHNGLHETEWRSNRLRTIAAVLDYHLSEAPYKAHGHKYGVQPSELRLSSSLHEELATLESGEQARFHSDLAYSLDKEIIGREDIPWYDQQKVHALLSLYDIDYRRALEPIMGSQDSQAEKDSSEFIAATQLDYYADLLQRVDYIDELLAVERQSDSSEERLLWSGRAHMLAGTLTEAAVLGDLRDTIFERNLHLTIEARQSYLREDHNPRIRRPGNPAKFITNPNFSFDLVLQHHSQRGPMNRLNIEVKKSRRAETYLETTYVLSAHDESTSTDFSRRMKLLCAGKIAQYSGQVVKPEEQAFLNDFRRRIKPNEMIEELLSRQLT